MNPYQILGVSKDATTDEIKAAYRKLARETHPDLNPGDAVAEARFKDISVAHELLSDSKKRADFDEFGEVSMSGGFDSERARAERDRFSSRFGSGSASSNGPPQGSHYGEEFAFGNLDDLFRQFQGQGGGQGHPGFSGSSTIRMRGADLNASMELGFIEAIEGGERRISLGQPAEDGRVVEKSINVRIPAGVTDGGRLRIPGKGAQGVGGGPSGDLWIDVRVKPHPVFQRVGTNIEIDLPITLAEAVCGAKVEIPTLDGRATLTIPPGTSSHAKLRMRGKGVPSGGKGQRGDLLARIKIKMPSEIPEDVLMALAQSEQDDPRKELF